MPAYLLAVCEVTNPHDNFKKYAAESARLIAEHGGEYVLRGPAAAMVKGEELKGKIVIMTKWDSMEQLEGFLTDPAYVEDCAPLREGSGNYEIATFEAAPPMPGK